MNKFKSCKGQFIKVGYISEKKPSKDFKGTELKKVTVGVFRAGIDFSNLSSTKEGIASGERGDVQPLKWGEWKDFPYTIEHKGAEYNRLYPSSIHKSKSLYFVNGKEVEKRHFASYLTPSEAKKLSSGTRPECFTVKAENCFFEDSEKVELAKLTELVAV